MKIFKLTWKGIRDLPITITAENAEEALQKWEKGEWEDKKIEDIVYENSKFLQDEEDFLRMRDKKYTHKIVMFDVNGKVRTALFTSEENSIFNRKWMEIVESNIYYDDAGVGFNLNNIVQINPVEGIES